MQSGRLFELLYLLLERGGMTVRELARRLEVSERTVRRDMEALSGAGVPIYAERGRNGGVRLLPGFVLNRTLLTQTEQDQILTALQTLQATGAGDERLLTHLQAVFRRSGWEWLDADFSDWSSSGRQRELFALIRQAIVQRRLISFRYYAQTGNCSRRTVEPMRLRFKGIAWYLQGWCRSREDFRVFKLSRMERPELLEESFAPRTDLPAMEYAAAGVPPVTVTIRFSPAVAFRVYDEFEPEQISRQPDGTLLVRAQWPAGAWGAACLLSYGAQAEVLSPPAMARRLRLEAEKIAALYSKEDNTCPHSSDIIGLSQKEEEST